MSLLGGLTHGFHNLVSSVVKGAPEAMFDVADFFNPMDMHATRNQLQQATFDILSGKTKIFSPERKTAKLLSVTDLVFREITVKYDGSSSAANALTKELDTTTYPTKATLRLHNDRGYDVYLRTAILQGKRIMQYSGEGGELIHDSLKRDDDIRRNGETVFEVGNEYIVTADQCVRIADFWYKFLGKKKHLYAVQIKGLAPWYEVGDWYNFQAGEADTNEYIDAVVEVFAVDCERSAGGIGSTTLLLRDVEDNWSKTTLYATRLATGGSPKRRVNRSNIITVASSEYDGTYDYRCDGTDDDVQIQAAIDYLSHTSGGGTVQLTNGSYTLAATLTIKSNVILKGVGNSTVLKPASASVTTMIDFGTATGSSIQDFAIDGDGSSITFITDAMNVIDGRSLGKSQNINITNYVFSCTSGAKTLSMFYRIESYGSRVFGNSNVCTGTSSYFYAFKNCTNVISCAVDTNVSSGAASARIYGYYICNNCTSSIFNSNSSSSNGGYLLGFSNCENVSSCSVSSNSTSYTTSKIYAFDTCTNVASCSSISNTTTQNYSTFISFAFCVNITSCISRLNDAGGSAATTSLFSFVSSTRILGCSTSGNTGSGGAARYGYYDCKSVQQCKSSDDSTAYSASYSDSGTTNACADTAAGGYNS